MGGRPVQPALPISAQPSADGMPPLLLVDGHNLLWAATFGFPAPIYSRDRTRLLTGVFAFFALLRVAIRDEIPGGHPEVIVVFDGQHGTEGRKQQHEQYKANRPATDEALLPLRFLADVKRGLDNRSVAWLELEHAEADDVIATLARVVAPRQVIIMSRDQDYYQLVDARVHVLNTKLRAGRRLVTPDEVYARHRITPSQWADYRALCGDPADVIPGIRGVGAKTAATLLDGGLTLEDLPSSGRLTTGRGRAVAHQLDLALKWRELIRLDADMRLPLVPIGSPSPPLPRPADVVEELGLW